MPFAGEQDHANPSRPNILLIVTDQQQYATGIVTPSGWRSSGSGA
jgi:hypothetical protein